MAAPTQQIVGRESELEQIGRFLDGIPNGPSSLLIEGEAGIGKTTLWLAGVDRGIERGLMVVVTRCGQSETTLSLSGLGDLMSPLLDEALPKIPPPLAADPTEPGLPHRVVPRSRVCRGQRTHAGTRRRRTRPR